MAEAPVEKYLLTAARKRGCLCLKLAIIGRNNFPDRTILMPGGVICFVECKDPTKDLRKTQRWFSNILIKLGFRVYVCKTKKQADQILNAEMEGTDLPAGLRVRGNQA